MREHLTHLPQLLEEWRSALPAEVPDGVAVTHGPGLAGGLAMGSAMAQAMALIFNCKIMGVNHLRGHGLSPFIPIVLGKMDPHPFLPHLGLLVSGGNTLLFSIDGHWRISLLADTVDDAAGEALDKGAKWLGLPYPGGVEIERAAALGDPKKFSFPRSFRSVGEKFSFYGLKTALRYQLAKMVPGEIEIERNNLCASYQEAIWDALAEKVEINLQKYPTQSLGLCGGVSQNLSLRQRLSQVGEKYALPLLLAPAQYCGDNASMIAFAAALDPEIVSHSREIFPRLPITIP
jgi:N6-L-threonylcarbamoyladenine synthase